jgi:hypothetical protein
VAVALACRRVAVQWSAGHEGGFDDELAGLGSPFVESAGDRAVLDALLNEVAAGPTRLNQRVPVM